MRRLAGTLVALISLANVLTAAPARGFAGQDQTRAQAQEPQFIRDLKYPPLNFSPPHPDKLVLPSGMVVFVLEDHEIPVVNIHAMIRCGGESDPADKVGLGELAGEVMRSGGTESLTPDQLNERVEFMAASIETSIGDDAGTAAMQSLTKDLDEALGLFADVLLHPAFRQQQFDIARNEMLDNIARQNDTAQSIESRIFPQLIYGKDSPIGRTPTVETVKRITRDDLISFHHQYIRPDRMVVGIDGDVNKDEIIRKIEQAFPAAPEETAPESAEPSYAIAKEHAIYFVQKDINQTSVRIGNLGLTRKNPDYFALRVALQILGGGFGSRIFNELRTREGLAYAASVSLSGGMREPGYILSFSETRADATARAIETILRLFQEIREQPVSDDELAAAKDTMLSSFVFAYDSPSKIVNQIVALEYYGLPLDFLRQFRDNVTKVTKEQVMEAAKKYIRPDVATILVVGNDRQFDKPLSSLGPVTTIDLAKW